MEWQVVPHPYSLTRSMLLPAFELFAIAHEYGHHVVKHGAVDSLEVGGEPEGLNQEFEADMFALGLCRYIERDKKQPNALLISGVAPVVLLKCLDLVRRTKGTFAGREFRAEASNTHPETEERILAFDSYIDGISPDLVNSFHQMRQNYCAIIDAIWNKFRPMYARMYDDGLRLHDGQSTWLP